MKLHLPILSSTAFIAIAFTAPSAFAGILYWDGGSVDILTNGNGAAVAAAGTWDTTIKNWDAGAVPHVAWNNANNDTAEFNNGTSSLALGADITVGRINNKGGGSGVSIGEGAGFYSITLGLASTQFNVAASTTVGRSLSLNAEVTGSNNLSIVGPTGALSGVVSLNRINTYTGTTTVNNTNLRIGNGGTAAQLNSGNYTNTISLIGTFNSTLTYSSSLNQILGGNITGTGSLTKNTSSNSILVLSGTTNTYSGGTTVSNGILTFQNTGAKPASGTVTVAAGATLGLGVATSGSFFTSANVDSLFAGTLSGVTNDAASNVGIDTTQGNFTYATSVSGSPARGLVKLGTNALTLTGSNTYTGTTNINAGTLALNGAGSIASSSTIIVGASTTFDVSTVTGGYSLAAAQTLSGTGTVAGAMSVSGTLSPGNSPGTMSTGSQTWLNGGDYNWQVLDTTGVAGTGFDQIAVTGTLDLTSLTAGGFNLNLWSLSSIAPDVNGDALNFNNALLQSWTILTTTGGITGFDAADFIINVGANNGAGGFSNALGGGAFSLGTASNNLILTFTPVPEPRAALLGSLGMLALLRRRRF